MPPFEPRRIVIHHSAELDLPTIEWSGIRRYQTSWRIDYMTVTPEEFARRKAAGEGSRFEEPWLDIGYHAGVERAAGEFEILYGRSWIMPGAHVIGYNSTSLGLCFLGNFTSEPPSDRQLAAGARIIRDWIFLFSIGMEWISRHDELNPGLTKCPGAAFPILRLIDMVATLIKGGKL